MKKLILKFTNKQFRRRGLVFTTLIALLGFMILPASAQVNSQKKYIFLSGQLTNTTTGAPIPDHQIYISSDSLVNNGFSYYATSKTDVNGFYRDTIVTSSSDGIIKVYLFDFDDIMIQLDRYYRFVWDDEYLMFADFAIFNPNANETLQANFTPQADPEENPLKIIFNDDSYGVSIKSWLWDFGDGQTSAVQDPEHIYNQPGVYMVSLTISAVPECQDCATSTITKQVQVGLAGFHHLGGHVFAEYFPIDLGLAYLYTYDAHNNLVPLDTTQIDIYGYYYFYELPVGKYLTKARLQASAALYGKFMPTYFGNVFDWQDATEIVLTDSDTNKWENHIYLLPSSDIAAGEGKITGQITYDTSLVERAPIPAGDIEILLLDGQGSNLTCKLSDMEGNFNFGNIPYGTYQLFPDVAGISTTPMYVTISEGDPLDKNVKLVIFPQQITFSISENISAYIDQAFLIYPNPVSDQARISLDVKKASGMTVMVTDLTGRIISRQDEQFTEGSQEIILPVGNLPAGFYQVLIIPEDKVMISGKFLKSNY
jgi:PKD repeat protein